MIAFLIVLSIKLRFFSFSKLLSFKVIACLSPNFFRAFHFNIKSV